LDAGARSCHILYPPQEAAEGWDAADAIAEGFDVASFLVHGPRMQIHALAEDAEPVVSSDESVWATEDALALAFTRRYHRDWRYVAAWGRWLVWDGQRWRNEDTLAATDLIRSVCRQTAAARRRPARSRQAGQLWHGRVAWSGWRVRTAVMQPPPMSGMLAHGCSTPPVAWSISRPGRTRANDRADRMTKITTATPGGECPQWTAFPRPT
jgi:putative DNA primase/helicase